MSRTQYVQPGSTDRQKCHSILNVLLFSNMLQCLDAVGWVTGRASGL